MTHIAGCYILHDDAWYLAESIASCRAAGPVFCFVSRVPWADEPGDWGATARIAAEAGAAARLRKLAPSEAAGCPPPPAAVGWPLVSVVIPLHGGAEDLRQCLDSIAKCADLCHEVIVVDNASPDDAAGAAEAFAAGVGAPPVRIVFDPARSPDRASPHVPPRVALVPSGVFTRSTAPPALRVSSRGIKTPLDIASVPSYHSRRTKRRRWGNSKRRGRSAKEGHAVWRRRTL